MALEIAASCSDGSWLDPGPASSTLAQQESNSRYPAMGVAQPFPQAPSTSRSDGANLEPEVDATVWPIGASTRSQADSASGRVTAASVPPTPSGGASLQRAALVIDRGGVGSRRDGSGGGGGAAAAEPAADADPDAAAAAAEPPPSPTADSAAGAASTSAGANSAVAALLKRVNSHLPHLHHLLGSAADAAAGGDLAVGSRPGIDAAAAAALAATNRARYATAVAASMQRQQRERLAPADLFLVVHVEAAQDLQPGRRGGLTTCDP